MREANDSDLRFMQAALREAAKAAAKNEVPIGAVAAAAGRVIARAHNSRETTQDPLGHAELLLLKKLARRRKSWRLTDVTVYVTLEPCLMCAGALFQAHVPRVVYAAPDPKAGVLGSLLDLSQDRRFPYRMAVTAGVLAAEAAVLLKAFFRRLRGSKKLLHRSTDGIGITRKLPAFSNNPRKLLKKVENREKPAARSADNT